MQTCICLQRKGGLKILVSENPEIQAVQDHQPGLVLSGVNDTTLNSTQASTQQQVLPDSHQAS